MHEMKIIDRLVNQLFRLNLQNRLVVGFLIATFITGFVATVVSIWTINKSTIDEVQNRVRQDINTAKLIYNQTLEKIASQIHIYCGGLGSAGDSWPAATIPKWKTCGV